MNGNEAILPEGARPDLVTGLMVLWQAHYYAQDIGADRWEFAVEIQQFYELGLDKNDLRWLVAKGLAEHGEETSRCGDARRSFEPTNGLSFSDSSALVLTESGGVFASRLFADSLTDADEAGSPAREQTAGRGCSDASPTGSGAVESDAGRKPRWDARQRKLFVGGAVVKWFRVPAASQEAVLAAFQEEAWPEYVDDPLPSFGEAVPKQRLQNAIKRLNANQTNCLIHFRGNGNGEGVGWELLSAAVQDVTAADHDRT